MRKIFIVSLVFLSGCVSFLESVTWDKVAMYQSANVYFSYPYEAEIGNGLMSYGGCDIGFGTEAPFDKYEEIDPEIRTHGGESYYSYFGGELSNLVLYVGQDAQFGYAFWSEDLIDGAEHCADLVNFMTKSLTDEAYYRNEEFSFSAPVLDDFDLKYLDDGMLLLKSFETPEEELDFEHEDRVPANYEVEMKAEAYVNDMEWADLGDLIDSEYSGYGAEFVDMGGSPAVYIEDLNGEDAFRYFFIMSEDVSVIYEARLKVPSVRYSKHKEFFDNEFAERIKIF